MPRPRLASPDVEQAPAALHGHVSRAPSSLTDSFEAVVPSFDRQHAFQIRRWMPRGEDLPVVGDEVLVVIDDVSEPWVPAWWPL